MERKKVNIKSGTAESTGKVMDNYLVYAIIKKGKEKANIKGGMVTGNYVLKSIIKKGS